MGVTFSVYEIIIHHPSIYLSVYAPFINAHTHIQPHTDGIERHKVTVRVPATSANLGPGYDTIGMAVDMWSEITVER